MSNGFATPLSGGSGQQLRSELTKMFERRSKKRRHKELTPDLAMVGLLFARPSDPFAKENVVPELDYLNSRSGEHMDLFCVGYTRKPRNPRLRGLPPTVTVKNVNWWFDNESFDDIREEVEHESKWKYSGGTELLIANARSSCDGSSIDYSSAIPCNLEQMQSDKAITNVREFFEKVFKYAENPDSENPAFGLSDKFGLGIAMNVIKKTILRILLRSLHEEYTKARHFVLADLSKPS
jgi:hypothetical protein